MRTFFDQEQSGLAPQDAPRIDIFPASFGAHPDPAEAIIAASPQVELFDEALWDIPKRYFEPQIYDDSTLNASDPEAALRTAIQHAPGAMPLVLGADCRSTRALCQAVEAPSLLLLTAHADDILAISGVPSRTGWGLRAISAKGAKAVTQKPAGLTMLWYGRNTSFSISGALVIGVDMSVFDPSQCPAVKMPEPGGPFWQEIIASIARACKNNRVLGMAITGLAPHSALHAADFLAAKLAYKMLTFAMAGKN